MNTQSNLAERLLTEGSVFLRDSKGSPTTEISFSGRVIGPFAGVIDDVLRVMLHTHLKGESNEGAVITLMTLLKLQLGDVVKNNEAAYLASEQTINREQQDAA
jgi:hypothetical protein